jgi:5-methylcytosine-specific restriction endonuclease McrA
MSRVGFLRIHAGRSARARRSATHPSSLKRGASRDTKRALKRATMRDCGRRCVYCARPLVLEIATLDHVHPVARGGTHHPGNLVTACARCNRLKGDMLPADFFARYPAAGQNFMRYARSVHRALKRGARRAVSLALAA